MPELLLCARACGEPAVGGHLSAAQVEQREIDRGAGGNVTLASIALPNNLCRAHLLEVAARDAVDCEVTGLYPIVGIDGQDVTTGGTVTLHPAQTDIPALVYARLVRIKPLATAKARADKAG